MRSLCRLSLCRILGSSTVLTALVLCSCATAPVSPQLDAERGSFDSSYFDDIPARDEVIAPAVAADLVSHGAVLVDARSESEFVAGHLLGAMNVPPDEVTHRIAESGVDSQRPVVVYCKSGRRAEKVRGELRSLGFTKIYNAGGYDALVSLFGSATGR